MTPLLMLAGMVLIIGLMSSTRETRAAGRRALRPLEPWLFLILVAFWTSVFWTWPRQ